MIVAIGEIPSSILIVIYLKEFSSLLFINQFIVILLKPMVLNYRPSLRGPFVENENLVFHSMA